MKIPSLEEYERESAAKVESAVRLSGNQAHGGGHGAAVADQTAGS